MRYTGFGLTLVLIAGATVGVRACPTALNIIPTADVLDPGAVSLQAEVDGHPTPLASGATLLLLTQVGLPGGVELGVDVFNLNHDDTFFWNAKWQLRAENQRYPAVAIGATDITHQGETRQWYVAATRSLPDDRTQLTVGHLYNDRHRSMVGVSYSLADPWALYADWTSGPEAYATLGVSRTLAGGWCALLYGARNNTSRDDGFVGLNLSWTGACW
jgi:hypothetical protein